MKPMRKKVYRVWLENQLARYERRIQKFAAQAYEIRQAINTLDRQEAARKQEKGETDNAIHTRELEAVIGSGESNPDSGKPELLNNQIIDTILGEQPTELRND